MSFEPIGLITVVVGLFCLLSGKSAVLTAFVLFCDLGSAAAILLGGANVQPAHLFLIFLCISTLFWRQIAVKVVAQFRFPEPAFWMLCLFLYGLASGYLMPRLFANQTLIVALGTTEHLITANGLVPLGPVSSNLTQPIYLLGDLICFAIIRALISTADGLKNLERAIILFTATNIGFAFLDQITAFTGTRDALSFIRNASYTFHDEESIGSLRRIIGSWPETSAFAGSTLGPCAFTGMLWLSGRNPSVTGPLAFVSLLLIIFSTSSAGLVGSFILVVMLYVMAVFRCSVRWQDRFSAAAVVAGPLIAVLFALVAFSIGGIAESIYDYFDTLILSKSLSASGIERSAWNAQAWQNFFDSFGLGVGLGTNRTSSFLLAILSNLGIPGAVFYMLFIVSVFSVESSVQRDYYSDVRAAARVACLITIVGNTIAGATVDQGLFFYILAACASARVSVEDLRTQIARSDDHQCVKQTF